MANPATLEVAPYEIPFAVSSEDEYEHDSEAILCVLRVRPKNHIVGDKDVKAGLLR